MHNTVGSLPLAKNALHSPTSIYKWKNHFSEMKGCQFMKKKGNKKMPRPRQEIIDNPIPTTSLFMCYAAVLLFGTGDAILRILVNL